MQTAAHATIPDISSTPLRKT